MTALTRANLLSTLDTSGLSGWISHRVNILDSFLFTGDTATTMTVTTLTSTTGNITTVNTGAIVGTDSSLGVDGQATAQGGAVVVTGGTSATAGLAGGAVSLVGGTPGSTGVGGAASVTAGAGGSASGNGGTTAVAGGAGTAGNGSGGPVTVTGGALQGSGVNGGVHLRSATGLIFQQQTAATTGIADGNWAPTAAQFINGILSGDVTTGRTLTTPTGAQLSAACGIGLAVGDAFNVYVVLVTSAGADDILTMTAGDGNVTFVGTLTVGPIVTNTAPGSATWRFRNTGTSTWVGYRIA